MRRTVLALTLAASTLTATPSGFFQPLWSFLSSLCGEAAPPNTKAGPGADPNGRTLVAPPNTKEGPGADPSGRTHPASLPSADAGPGADPWGSH
jgi:hypothetical protein